MKKWLPVVFIILYALGSFLAVDYMQSRERELASNAFVAECRARAHVWATIDNVLWDLNACG